MPKSRATDLLPLALECLSLGLAISLWSSRLDAQTIRAGSELQVNSHTTGIQRSSSVSLDADGDFVVAWQSSDLFGNSYGAFGRRFSSAGTALAAEFQVSSYTAGSQGYLSVSLDAGGDFVVAWASAAQDGDGYGIFARRFSSAGIALAAEFQVNSYTTGDQYRVRVSVADGGDFVAAWESEAQDGSSDGIFARRFSAAGDPEGVEFQITSYTTSAQRFPSVSLDTDGDFVVAWESTGQDAGTTGVFARRFSAAGTAQAAEFRVNSYTVNTQRGASVSLDADGDFVVAWESIGQDGGTTGVFARRFSSAGTAQAAEFRANSYTANTQRAPSVHLDAGGGFVVAWQSLDQDGSNYGVFARRFSAAGTAEAAEFQVSSYTTNFQYRPSLSFDDDGDFVVAWTSQGQDGSSEGIFAQRFETPADLDIDGNGTSRALTDGILFLRYLSGFSDMALVDGAVDAGNCTRCAAAAIEAYLASKVAARTTRVGVEFQVNSYTPDHQYQPSLSLDEDGDFVVAWQSNGQDGSDFGVFARRFSSAGGAQAGEFQVSSYTTSDQRDPSVSLDADGDFVVAWQSNGQDGSSYGIFAQRFSSGGTAQAGEFQVSSYTPSLQRLPSLSLDADGDFVVAWESYYQDGSGPGVFARQFSAAGVAQAGEFQVSSHTQSSQRFPSVSLADAGDFVVAWESNNQDGSETGVFARRFSSQSVAQAGEFQVTSHTYVKQRSASVSLDEGGDFVVAWQSFAQDGSGYGAFARRFSSQVVAQAVEFQLSSVTADNQSFPSVSLDDVGDFVVAWASLGQDGSGDGVFARRFSSDGTALGAELQVSSHITNHQRYPSVSLDDGGGFVVAWASLGQDGSSNGVFAQSFRTAIPFDIDGNGATDALTDGVLVVRYLFDFRGAKLIEGAVDLVDCTRCDAGSIEAHLATLQ